MAGRIRSIKPELLDDEVGAALSDAAWRLWVAMRPLADDHGNLQASPRYLAAQVWMDTSKDATTPLQELVQAEKVLVYVVDGRPYAHINGWETEQRVDNAGKPRVPLPPAAGLAAAAPAAVAALGEPPRAHEHPQEPAANLRESPRLAENSANLGEPPQVAEESANLRESPRLAENSANLGEPPQLAEVRGLAHTRAPALPDLRPPTSDPDHEPEEEESHAGAGVRARRAVKCDRRALVHVLLQVTKSVPHTRLINAVASIADHAAAAAPDVDANEYARRFAETYAEWRKAFPMTPPWAPDAVEKHATSVQRVMSGEDPMPKPAGADNGGKGKARDLRRGRADVSDWSEA